MDRAYAKKEAAEARTQSKALDVAPAAARFLRDERAQFAIAREATLSFKTLMSANDEFDILEHQDDHKLAKSSVMYFDEKLIGDAKGAACKDCFAFIAPASCALVSDEISADGVCGLFVRGRPQGAKLRVEKVTKRAAGYTDDGPSHCESCVFFDGSGWRCAKVEGLIQPEGCCVLWERK